MATDQPVPAEPDLIVVERILAQLAELEARTDAASTGRCDCGCRWSEHTQNPTTPDWLECGRCQRSCFND